MITYVWAKDAYNQFRMGVPAVDSKPSASRRNDNYGNTTYTTYNERYAYQNPTGRDNYGSPTYDPDK